MAKSNITIAFKGIGVDGALNVALDAEKHIEAYGTAKSDFSYGEDVWIKVYPEPETLKIEALLSFGNVSVDGSGYEDVTDRLTFDYSIENNLSKLPRSSDGVNLYWFGNQPGKNPTIENKRIFFSSEQVAICEATYTTFFKRFKLSGISQQEDSEFPVIVVFKGF